LASSNPGSRHAAAIREFTLRPSVYLAARNFLAIDEEEMRVLAPDLTASSCGDM
jgi:hypothetical protein